MTEELGELYGEIVINMVTEPATQTRHRGHVSSSWVNIEQLLFPA